MDPIQKIVSGIRSLGGFWWLTFAALMGLFTITLSGSIATDQNKTPSISVMIDDAPWLRYIYGLLVGALIVSRTGLIYDSGFYRLSDKVWDKDKNRYVLRDWGPFWNTFLPRFAFVCGSMQLVSFSVVAHFSVVLDPWYHYAAALSTVVFGLTCEFVLWLRRRYRLDEVDEFGGWTSWWNLIVWGGAYGSLFTFGMITKLDYYAELKSNIAIAEWVGYYLMAYLNYFRIYDMKILKLTKREEDEAANDQDDVGKKSASDWMKITTATAGVSASKRRDAISSSAFYYAL